MSLFKNYFKQGLMVIFVALFSTNVMPKVLKAPAGVQSQVKPAGGDFEEKRLAMKEQQAGQAGLEQKRTGLVREKSLARVQEAEARRAGIDLRSLQAIQDSIEADRYTQTEAYLQLPKLRELITDEFGGSREVVRNMGVVSRIMAKEAELRGSHWQMYHGMDNEWMTWQDTLTKLSYHFNPLFAQQNKDFIFLRTKGGGVNQSVKEFLVGALKADGLVDDNNEQKGLLLSVNFCPFGNTGQKGESTWRLFMEAHSHTEPTRADYERIMDQFQLSHAHIDELMNLSKEVSSKKQSLLQICIPKNMIDDVGYLSWVAGVPAHDELISWVRSNVKNKKYKSGHGKTGDLRAIADLKNRFKKMQEKDPLFKKMLESIEKGEDYSINAYLKTYCSKPWELPGLNYAQARLLLSNDTLLNPQSGIKMFRYNEIAHSEIENYEKRLDQIIKKIIAVKSR